MFLAQLPVSEFQPLPMQKLYILAHIKSQGKTSRRIQCLCTLKSAYEGNLLLKHLGMHVGKMGTVT